MKILAFQGSPRLRGNTAILLSQFVNGARAEGAEVDVVNLHEQNIHPCDACDMCECGEKPFCVYNDSMRDIMKKVRGADAFVLATPVWWTGASSLTKIFLDRLYGYKTRDYFGGKGIFLITTYFDNHIHQQPLPGADIVGYVIQSVSDFTGMEFIGHLRSAVVGTVLEDTSILDRAFKEGKRFASVLMAAKQ
ncbi:MAG: flavodoxin family protein [Synergistaceae bacterium]|nr:flavodoxin family protein [Synergistaceae bacterium]